MSLRRNVHLEKKHISMLSKETRSISFDEEKLSANQKRMQHHDSHDKTESKQLPSPIAKAFRTKSLTALNEQLSKTEKLTHILKLDPESEIIQHINKMLSKSRRAIVLTGAGISCNAGIPDFRSSDGLYNLVKKEHPDISLGSGKEMFDISLFRDELKIAVWATFMEKLYSSCKLAKPTKTHKFIAHLKDRNKLLRCYTQNIDGLEETLGLEISGKQSESQDVNPTSGRGSSTAFSNAMWKNLDVVQLHGDLNTLSCTRCFHVFQWSRYWARSFRRGELPICPNCEAIKMKRSEEGKRVIDHNGMLRPNIVLYGENHPSGDLITQGLNLDILRGKPDFFIIMGTSLKVDGVRKVVKQISRQVHERGGLVILVNKTSVGESTWNGCIDYQIWEDCDTWVKFLEEQIPDFFKSQKQVDKIRLLKREASELRKKTVLDNKKKQESESINTPPNTPPREHDNKKATKNVKNEINSNHESSSEESDSNNEFELLKGLKRKLIPSEDKIFSVKRTKTEVFTQKAKVMTLDSESDDDILAIKQETSMIFKQETHLTISN